LKQQLKDAISTYVDLVSDLRGQAAGAGSAMFGSSSDEDSDAMQDVEEDDSMVDDSVTAGRVRRAAAEPEPAVRQPRDDAEKKAKEMEIRSNLFALTGYVDRKSKTLVRGVFELNNPVLPGGFTVTMDGVINVPSVLVESDQAGLSSGFLSFIAADTKFSEFYKNPVNRSKYEDTLYVAMALSHMQLSSAESERVFSAAGLINTDLRTRLSSEKLAKMVAARLELKRRGPEFANEIVEKLAKSTRS
jgi:hypothetical protein